MDRSISIASDMFVDRSVITAIDVVLQAVPV